MKYLITIGLEVHAQLATKTKIFCGCELRFAEAPNSRVCPVCLGLPGALPVLNKEAFRLGLRGVLALKGKPSKKIKFDRKNYFYPDLPKGYQISQYDMPLGCGGFVEIEVNGIAKKITLNRLHLEEDAGKLIHDQSQTSSFVDLNRAGTPLAEIVSEPEIETPDEAYAYLTNLKAILKATGVSECDMEKGHLRCDANVSLRKAKEDKLGKKVEVKNLNSFKAVKAALEYEIIRQAEALDKNEVIPQETRLWDDARAKTFSMRSKEDAHDYRYFPEPDLVPFFLTDEQIQKAADELPELPKEKIQRFISRYQLSAYDAGLLCQENDIAVFYEKCVVLGAEPKAIANWMTGPVFAYLSEKNQDIRQTCLSEELLVKIYTLVSQSKMSFQAAKEKVFPDVIESGQDPEEVMKQKGLQQVSDDSAISSWIDEAIAENAKVVEDFRSGKDSAIMFLVGQAMKKSKGKAHPVKVQELMRKKLS